MAKIWTDPIDKTIDWGGDENTGGLPVSGARVQEFIKDSLNSKAGVFYYDVANNRYLVFADTMDKDEYLLDPTKTELILGTFDAPFNYSAEINLTSTTYAAVPLGSTGHYVDFTFDVKNKQGNSTGENVNITYTFIRNASKVVVRESRKYGDSIHFNIDKYLGEGTNTIIVGVTGQTSLAATTASITYQVVNLQLEDNVDISKVYHLTTGAKTLEIPFNLSGYGTKIVEWYIDGAKLEFVKNEDEVVDVATSRTKYIPLTDINHGRHTLQIRAYTTINGDRFYTDTLYRDFFVNTGVGKDLMIGVALTIPYEYGIVGAEQSVSIYNMTQYIPYQLRFATYSPTNAANTEISVVFDDEVANVVNSVNDAENFVSITATKAGSSTLILRAEGAEYPISVNVDDTAMDLRDITTDLAFDFSALGRNNKATDKDSWSYEDYVGTFEGFNWNNTSGWVNNRLEMNAGSSFGINYAPLANKPTNTGKTIEIEWASKNVKNDDAILCDLRNADGVGLLITATKVTLSSKDGVVLDTEYKSEENVRVVFVINKSSGVTNQTLSFIYANGILSRAGKWASSDDYTSDTELLFTATEDAEISLKAIRVYNAALTSDQILNNYTLYRDNVTDMLAVYDRNNIYVEGTTTFSPEKMQGRLPVMIVTGDIPTLENTSDKDTQIIVDIEYTNMQDPSRSFRMEGAAMRPQGTSSMGYPKKNFRIYTQKVDGTKLYDSEGKIVEDKLYQFKEGAQPVDCWCLKADYAESSGTHNTGIARLWNKALFDARVTYSFGDEDPRNINNEPVLRTKAQQHAVNINYPYDVRTTIDGFPILVFYRLTPDDDLIFIGKYNFNNDKSTEAVFGFKGIKGFDNSKVQCWEILNNGNELALFTTTIGFDSGWKEAFEARYPDKSTKVSDLKAFCTWMSTVSEEDFATQKWAHLDVYKMAAYWIYLMRHAGADQFVKNAMFTSEDGVHWFFILYDNDTINGLINTGRIAIKPTDGRQTVDATGSYVFAGHDSRLWNMLEADAEFQSIVAAVDNALYSAGISYENTIKEFDEEQADKWAERVYNQDAQYKYIGPFNDKGTDNLFMLQGKRDLHRKWWLAKRFSIYDAKYVSGTYKSKAVELKCLNGTPAGQQFSVTAGAPLDYGYGINNVPREYGVTLDTGESHEFTTTEVVNLGDPIRIYGAYNIQRLDLSKMASRLTNVNIEAVSDPALGSRLKELIIGKSGVTNVSDFAFSGLKQATALRYLDVQGIKSLTSLDLSNQPYFETLIASNSSVSSVTFAKGAPVKRLVLPQMNSLTLEELPYLEGKNISIESISNITSIIIKACPKVSNDFSFIYNWFASKTADSANCSLVMDGVNWIDVNADQLIELKELGELKLKGKVTVVDLTLEQINSLIDVFGESAFDKNADFFINAADAIFITGRTELLEGESEDYNCIVFGGEVTSLTWSLVSGASSYISINPDTGLLTSQEGAGDRTVTIRVIAKTTEGTKSKDIDIRFSALVYPSSSQITLSGPSSITKVRETYEVVFTTEVTASLIYTWSLTGLDGFAEIESTNNGSCVVKKVADTSSLVQGTLSCTVKKKYNNSTIATKTISIAVVNENIAETDKGIVTALFNAGLCANSTYITKDEAALIADVDLQPGTSSSTSIFYAQRNNIKTFSGIKYFTGLTKIPAYLFQSTRLSGTLELPSSIRSIETYAFYQCALEKVVIPNEVFLIGDSAFAYCSALKSANIPSLITSIGGSAFKNTPLEGDLIFPETLKTFGNAAFGGTNISSCVIPQSVTSIPAFTFENCKNLRSVVLPQSLTSIGQSSFAGCPNISVTIPAGCNILNDSFKACFYGNITVAEGHPRLEMYNGFLCAKDYYYTAFTCTMSPSDTECIIPDKIQQIASPLFSGCETIQRVTFPPSVRLYESEARYFFSNCKALISVENLPVYAPYMFQNCASLESITLSTQSSPTEIPENCFASSGLKSFSIPEGIQRIGSSSFSSCASLSSVNFPTSLKRIGGYAFTGTALEEVTIPRSVEQIESQAFGYCYALTTVDIPADLNISQFPSYLFADCRELESITIPFGVTSIGSVCFRGCHNLKTIHSYPATAPTIASDAFNSSNQSGFTGGLTAKAGTNKLYVLPNATGYNSGAWLDPLQRSDRCGFTIEESLELPMVDPVETDAGICAALYNAGLIANSYYVSKSEAEAITASQLNPQGTAASSIFVNYRSQIKSFKGFKNFTAVTQIPFGTFRECSNMTEIELPETLTSIGEQAFYGCTKLTKIVIPDSVTNVGNSICYNCAALKEVVLSKNITMLTSFMFSYCPIESIELHEGITLIGNEALEGHKLAELTIPNSVTEIGNMGIAGAGAPITKITLGSGLKKLGGYNFSGKKSLREIISLATTAPTVQSTEFGTTEGQWVGRDSYSTGENMLYVPAGATGYDTSYWADPLQNAEKCGFTLSATL